MALSESLLFSTLKITRFMKLLKTEDGKYLLWVDETKELERGQWVWYKHPAHNHGMLTNIFNPKYSDYAPYGVQHTEGWGVREGYSVVTAYLPLTPDAAPLDGVPLLPPLPYRVGDNLIDAYTKHIGRQLKLLEVNLIDWFAASGERTYSEEDIRRAVEKGVEIGFNNTQCNYHTIGEPTLHHIGVHNGIEEYIQSLSPAAPLPVAFEPEYYYQNRYNDEWYSMPDKEAKATKYKTITLPNGQEQLVGGYKYKED